MGCQQTNKIHPINHIIKNKNKQSILVLEYEKQTQEQIDHKTYSLLHYAIEGNLPLTQKVCQIHQLKSITKIIGYPSQVQLFDETIQTDDWNPFHFAIYYKHIHLVKYYLEDLQVNPRLSLMGPYITDPNEIKSSLISFPSIDTLCFSLALTVHNKDENMLNYLLNDFSQEGKLYAYPLWNSECISFILKGVVMENWLKGIDIVLKGSCVEHIYLSMDYFQRLDFVGEQFGKNMQNQDQQIKEMLMKISAEFPFAGISIQFLCEDVNCGSEIIEQCLENITIDDLEMIYNYDIDSLPQIVKNLRERDINKELLTRVFKDNMQNLKDKDQVKLHYYEFIDYCINGNIQEAKFFVRKNEINSVSYFYGLKKLLRLQHKSEPANTKYFSPLLHSIYYNKKEMIEFMIKSDLINGFSNLKEPPSTYTDDDEDNEELGIADDQWFNNVEIEIFVLEILISQGNYELIEAVMFKYFTNLWHFAHFNLILEQAMQRSDNITLEFILSQSICKECFESLPSTEQTSVLSFFISQSLSLMQDDIQAKEKRVEATKTILNSFSQRPYCALFLFLSIGFESDIKEKLSNQFYDQVFARTFKNTRDVDIDTLIKIKQDEIKEITSDTFKSENKESLQIVAIINRIEKRINF